MNLEWAEAQMRFIEGIRTVPGEIFFGGLTLLGLEPFLLFFVAFGYWLYKRSVFIRATAMLIVAAFLNSWLKGVFLEPRPSVVSHVVEASGWSFPSGHAQVAAALWGSLAIEVWRGQGSQLRQRSAAVALVMLAVGISISRPYLGVHYPHDVAVGFALGGVQAGLVLVLGPLSDRRRSWILGAAMGSLAAALWAAIGFHPTTEGAGVRLAGAGLGLSLGLAVPHRALDSTQERALLAVIGLVGTLVLWAGLRRLLWQLGIAELGGVAFARYVLVGLWIAGGALWVTGQVLGDLRSSSEQLKL